MREIKFEDLNPIFIMGCQRSGTTMLASQLAAPKNSIALPELPFIIGLINDELNEKKSAFAYKKLVKHPKFHTLGINIDSHKFSHAWSMKKAKGAIELIINDYLSINEIALKTSGPINWIEHCPTNISNFHLLKSFFSKAKFINIVRDPRAIYSSMKAMARWEVSEPLKLSVIWIRSVSKGFLFSSNYPEKVKQIRYEDYVKDSDLLKELCYFLDVEFEEDMSFGGGVILPKFTESQHKLTRGKVSTSRLDDWKHKISQREADAIVNSCYEWLVELEYLEENTKLRAPSANQKRFWRIKGFAYDLRARILNKLILKGLLPSQ